MKVDFYVVFSKIKYFSFSVFNVALTTTLHGCKVR